MSKTYIATTQIDFGKGHVVNTGDPVEWPKSKKDQAEIVRLVEAGVLKSSDPLLDEQEIQADQGSFMATGNAQVDQMMTDAVAEIARMNAEAAEEVGIIKSAGLEALAGSKDELMLEIEGLEADKSSLEEELESLKAHAKAEIETWKAEAQADIDAQLAPKVKGTKGD